MKEVKRYFILNWFDFHRIFEFTNGNPATQSSITLRDDTLFLQILCMCGINKQTTTTTNYCMIFRFWNSTNHSIILLIRNSFNWINIINVEHSRSDQLGYAYIHRHTQTRTQTHTDHNSSSHIFIKKKHIAYDKRHTEKLTTAKRPYTQWNDTVYITIAIAFDRFISVRSLTVYLRECERWWNWVMANAKHYFVDRSEFLFVLSFDAFVFFWFSPLGWLEKRSNLNIMFASATPQFKDTASDSTSSICVRSIRTYIILMFPFVCGLAVQLHAI